MAPEMFSQKQVKYDPMKADLFALGATLFYIISHG
jgi:serine/threonine protein kinase